MLGVEELYRISPRRGDVVFTNGTPFLVAIQSLVRLRKVYSSHVMFVMGSNYFLHSMPNQGVAIQNWSDWPEIPISKAYRCDDYLDPERFSDEMFASFGRKYNYALGFKKRPLFREKFSESLFCSELVANFLTEADRISLRRKYPFPADLERIMIKPRWRDVTGEYKAYLAHENDEARVHLDKFDRSFIDIIRNHVVRIRENLEESKKTAVEVQKRKQRMDDFVNSQLAEMRCETEALRKKILRLGL
jgi:hypothetical protein